MFAWWGTVMSRIRWLIVALTLGFVGFAGVWGTGVFDRLADDGSLSDPNSESQRIVARVAEEIGRTNTHLVALYSSRSMTVDDPMYAREVARIVQRVEDSGVVASVVSFYETQAPGLVSTDRRATYLPIRFVEGTSEAGVLDVRQRLRADGLTTQIGGPLAVDQDVSDQVGEDMVRAELIAMPLLLLLLVLIFRSVVAAMMPLLIGGVAILGAFTAVRGLTTVTDVSVFSINIITILGLGLAVDYALFVVSRFREEMARGCPVEVAVSRTMATAGRTVAVSGVIVSLSLCGLLMFPHLLLRSMGLGGSAAVAIAMLTSLTVLPAMLAVLGHRIDSLRVPSLRRRPKSIVDEVVNNVDKPVDNRVDNGIWARIAASVMRRPVMYTVAVIALLVALAAPFTTVSFGGVDERVLPAGTESRTVSERLKTEFAGDVSDPIFVLVSGADEAATQDFAARVEAVPGVRDSRVASNRGTSTMLAVRYDGQANSDGARAAVRTIRDLTPPPGAEIMVGGRTADLVDQLDSLADRLVWMALLVAGITFVLLSFAFGSLLIPLKAIVMNLLSIGAAFGVVVWVFQDGHLSDLLGFTPTGTIDASQPILMVAILFGLSMDYEVFLLSRMREQWDKLGDNTAAVATGVQRTGAIITAAALLLCVVVGAFATSGITFIKMIGVGMLVALIVDATLVRLLLVPATMRLLGRANWWAPRPLRKLYARYGFHESDDLDEPVLVPPAPKPEPAGVR